MTRYDRYGRPMEECPACGSTGREAMELARLRAKHRQFADQTNQLITEQAAEIRSLRDQLTERPAS